MSTMSEITQKSIESIYSPEYLKGLDLKREAIERAFMDGECGYVIDSLMDLERKSEASGELHRYPFHGIDHFRSVAKAAAQNSAEFCHSDPEFMAAAVDMLGLRDLSPGEQINAIIVATMIAGYAHDFGNYIRPPEPDEPLEFINIQAGEGLERPGHEMRSVTALRRELGLNPLEEKSNRQLLNILQRAGIKEHAKFLDFAYISIMGTKLKAEGSDNQILFDSAGGYREWIEVLKASPTLRFDNTDKQPSDYTKVASPLALADLQFSPEVKAAWRRLWDEA